MKKYNTTAIVLKNINYKDADKIYTLLTREQGKISVFARGVRKITSRRAGSLDSLNLISLKISEDDKNFKNLDEVKTLNSFKNIKNDFTLVKKSYYLCELVNKSVEEGIGAEFVFDLFKKVLEAMDRKQVRPDILVAFFEVYFLKFLGYMPNTTPNLEMLQNLIKANFKEIDEKSLKIIETWAKSNIFENITDRFKSLEML